MITTAYLPETVTARRIGDPFDHYRVGSEVQLFRGMRGNVQRWHANPAHFCIFEEGNSGARYLVETGRLRFEVRDTMGIYAPKPEER